MTRLAQNTSNELTLTVYKDGATIDADAPPEVTLTRNGIEINVLTAAKVGAADSGRYVLVAPDSVMSTLGEFEATWRYAVDGFDTDTVFDYEVVGREIVTLAELRAMWNPLGERVGQSLDPDAAYKYPDELVLETRDAVIEALEHACRVPFVRRRRTESFDDPAAYTQLALEWHRRPTIVACNVNGIDLDEVSLAYVTAGKGGLVRRQYGAFGRAAAITYEAGYDQPPGRVKRGICMLTRDWIVENVNDALPSRATSWSAGENTYRLITAGVAGALFDLPEANAIVKQYGE